MNIEIIQSLASGKIIVPPSKSMAHRALICAGLSEGVSTISNLDYSEDILATIDCLKALGIKVELFKDNAKIIGIGWKNIQSENILNCRESGSTLRFFIPICLLMSKTFTLTGTEKLISRPLDVYKEISKEQGLIFSQEESELKVCGPISSGSFIIPGNISSQFITGLLFILPLLDKESLLEITGSLESRSYVNMTIQMMNTFGVKVTWLNDHTIKIGGNQEYKPTDYTVEGDYSNAAFLDALNYVGGDVKVSGLSETSMQGDKVYRGIFADISNGSPTVSLSDCPDLAPICIALAAEHNGAVFTETRRLEMKESNRGIAMAEELSKFGMEISVLENKIIVPKGVLKNPECHLNSHNDHRIAMALAVLLAKYGGFIDGAEAVRKSYPNFFSDIENLGIKVIKNEN